MNSIKNVPARVLNRRPGHSLEAEREQFDKTQAISISKAINTQEAPVKEKHARRIILGTHHEKGAFTFWSYAIGLPLPSSAILSWKFCHVLHKVLRDGHPNVLHDCQRYRSNIREIGDLWGHLHDRYGQLVNIYTKLLLTKIAFHLKHPQFPAGLEVTDEVLEKAAGTDVNNIFQLTVEMFDYMDCELKLSESVFRQLNTAIAVSQMSSGQCRLAPLIQVIQDCSHLYHYTVKLMFKLHSCLPADTLQGHRDRFHEQFHSLRNFFRRASDMLYFKRLIQIPRLPEVPAPSSGRHKTGGCVPVPQGPWVTELERQGPLTSVSRDLQIEALKREVEMLRSELDKIKLEAQRFISQLKGQVNALEAELEEQRKQKQKALVDNEQLRHELAQLRAAQVEGERNQGLREEAEKKASATEARYNKLKEKHSELVNTHAELLRKNADTAKQLTVTQQSQEEPVSTAPCNILSHHVQLEEQSDQLEKLKRELEAKAGELVRVQEALSRTEQSGSELSSRLDALSADRDELSRVVQQREADLLAAQSLAREKEAALSQERQRISRERDELQGRLADKESQEQGLQQRLLDEQFAMLRATAAEAERILQDAVGKLDDPLHLRCTSSPAHRKAGPLPALWTCGLRLEMKGRVRAGYWGRLMGQLQEQQALLQARPGLVRTPLQGIFQLGQELKPKSLDVREEELGAMVDKEMAATSAAIEDAVRRIEDMMNQARHASSGVKLEVNERILNSCTDLMKAIRLLVTTSTSLQKEIVESGRGAATQQEFYAKNSRWTEGLISASKAVGWGATWALGAPHTWHMQTSARGAGEAGVRPGPQSSSAPLHAEGLLAAVAPLPHAQPEAENIGYEPRVKLRHSTGTARPAGATVRCLHQTTLRHFTCISTCTELDVHFSESFPEWSWACLDERAPPPPPRPGKGGDPGSACSLLVLTVLLAINALTDVTLGPVRSRAWCFTSAARTLGGEGAHCLYSGALGLQKALLVLFLPRSVRLVSQGEGCDSGAPVCPSQRPPP
ncbi:PREDICTED: huntingtin-interacting protein 1-related protein [Bison bison bison]|uniref:Huntingtin-interacting protein 1-related protein n=1 Tax=Bison bison bison TaxID=43346 RepID=A0A6P3HJW5_BISBB|nr:PREDICTED: huntingtin-interacting protein 1-related protein [Bison bison bison]